MLQEIRRHVVARESFAFETTLAGRGYATLIPRWQQLGYRVKLIFLQLDQPATAIARVAERVRQGGHDVPEATIRRRFTAGLRNFREVYAPLVDAWALYDNTQGHAVPLDWSSKHE